MNEAFPVSGMRRALLCVTALAFLATALAAVRQRITQPDLVVPAAPGRMQAGDAAAPGGMDEIGALMQKIQQDPGDVSSMVHLAEHFIQDGNRQAAENFLRRAVVAAPADAQPLYLLGVVLHQQGKHEEAAACFERVLSLRDEPSTRYSLGVLYVHYLHKAERGAEHLRIALTQPDLPEELAELIRTEMRNLPAQERAAPSASGKTPAGAKP